MADQLGAARVEERRRELLTGYYAAPITGVDRGWGSCWPGSTRTACARRR